MLFGLDIFALVLVVLAIITLFAGVKTVPQGYNWTVERFGKYTRTLAARPVRSSSRSSTAIGTKMNMMEQVLDIPQQDVITKDNATVTVDGVAFFQVFDAAKAQLPTRVADLQESIADEPDHDQYPLGDGFDGPRRDAVHRDQINERLLRVVDACGLAWGVKVNRIEIKDIVAACRSGAGDGTADEGRAREARRDPRRRRGSAPPKSCVPRAPSRRRSWRPRAARRPPSATPRRASAPRRPKRRRPNAGQRRSPAVTSPRSTISSPRNI
jgi:hypothetical protein